MRAFVLIPILFINKIGLYLQTEIIIDIIHKVGNINELSHS